MHEVISGLGKYFCLSRDCLATDDIVDEGGMVRRNLDISMMFTSILEHD